MSYQITIVSVIIAAIAIQAKQLDPGPQTFKNTNSSTSGAAQNQQKRFATNDVIVFLTPSQIKDLQAGKAELRSQSSGEITINQSSKTQKMTYQNPQAAYRSHLENLNILKSPLQEPQLYNKQEEQQGEGYFNILNVSPVNQAEGSPKLIFFSPEAQGPESSKLNDNIRNQDDNQNEWTPDVPPVIPVTEKNLEDAPLQEQYNKLPQNRFANENNERVKLVTNIHYNQPEIRSQGNSQFAVDAQQQFEHNYNPLIYALAQENALRERNNEIEKQRALAQADAIANSPPVIVHKEVQITKHKQVPVVKQVNVPYPSPVLVPVLQPYELKFPQPYPVPAENTKNIPAPEVRAEKPDAEKAMPYQVKKHTLGKNVYINVDSPSYIHHIY